MVYYEDSRKRTPLHLSAYQGHEAVAQTLCRHAAVIDAVDEVGVTALHLATLRRSHGHSEATVGRGGRCKCAGIRRRLSAAQRNKQGAQPCTASTTRVWR